MQLKIIGRRELQGETGRLIRKGLCVCFPADRDVFSKTLAWHGSVPSWGVVLEAGDRVISHVAVVDRTIRVGKESLQAAGIQNVFVLPEGRGKGLSQQVMNEAMREAL